MAKKNSGDIRETIDASLLENIKHTGHTLLLLLHCFSNLILFYPVLCN